MPDVDSWKQALVGLTGLSKDALHVYVGLGVVFFGAGAFGWSLRGGKPWLLAVIVALLGELVDTGLTILGHGPPSWGATWHDLWNTLFWPTVLLGLARFSALLSRE